MVRNRGLPPTLRGSGAVVGEAPGRRSRWLTGLLIVVTVIAGLASRRAGGGVPDFVVAYGGDALWAALVFWIGAFIRPAAETRRLALGALAFAVAIELSQLYHAPWLDALRATRLGALVLGQGFLASDLVCYAAGVAMAAAIDLALARRERSRLAAMWVTIVFLLTA